MSAEIKDEIKMEYGWPERANLLWKVLEQMYGSSNSKRSSSSAPENISSSSTHFDQDQEEQSSVQKEELNSASLGKPDGSVSQTGVSGFGSSNSAVSFVKFQNHLFTPSRRHQGTFNWYQNLIS